MGRRKRKSTGKKKSIFIKRYLSEKYPLSGSKVSRIIQEQAEKYINMEEYKSFFLKHQSKNLSDNIKKSKRLSNAPEDINSYFYT